ncbi:MAG: phage tail protein [Methylococcaceae bacterium]|nr:phage tail protein [Methylococcaceae bacterium]
MANRPDPYRVYKFKVEIDGITRGGFREASGLDSSQDPIEYREGTDPLHAKKLPGLNKSSNISLKWGVSDDNELWEWRKKCIDGKVERKNGSIVLYNDAGEEKHRWNFVEAWPTKWTGPSFNATGNEVAIDAIEIAHEGITKG